MIFSTWENYSYIFMNGISRKHLNLDVINRFSFKIFKYIEFRMDMHIIYNYFDSYKLQFQNDFTSGLIYGLNRKF